MTAPSSLASFALVLLVGCGSSDATSPVTDSEVDSSTDSGRDVSTDTTLDTSDAPANTCTPAGGTCVAVTATSKCPDGSRVATDPAVHCEGVGAMCCLPDATDGGKDSGGDATDAPSDGGAEAGCVASGGTVGTATCCLSTADFPNSCLDGACGCGPSSSHVVKVCTCGAGKCFDGKACVTAG